MSRAGSRGHEPLRAFAERFFRAKGCGLEGGDGATGRARSREVPELMGFEEKEPMQLGEEVGGRKSLGGELLVEFGAKELVDRRVTHVLSFKSKLYWRSPPIFTCAKPD